jgi:hypothetical protein
MRIRHATTLALAVTLALLSTLPGMAQSPFPHAWGIEHVDSAGDHVSLVLEPIAPYTPHISYAGNGLRYAIHDGSNWSIEVVDEVRVWGGTAVAVAQTEPYAPAIAYYDADNFVLKFARQIEPGAWSINTVDNVGDRHWGISLALEPAPPHVAHIAYLADGNLKYARGTGGTWSIEPVDYKTDADRSLDSPSIALPPSAPSEPLISYHDTNSGYVKLARRVGGSWNLETVAFSLNGNGHTSLALDSGENPHIAYNEWSNRYLKYARRTGATWAIESAGGSGYPSLALDSDDQPRIGYVIDGIGSLRFAYKSDSTWTRETVDGMVSTGWNVPSMALDGDGLPRIVYNDDGLAYAYYYLVTYSVSGRVFDWSGNPLAGAQISAGEGRTTTTDLTGQYMFEELLPGSYTITPTLIGYVFMPPARTVAVPPDASRVNFYVLPAAVSTTLAMSGTTNLPGRLAVVDTQGLTTTLDFPAGAVTGTTTIVLTSTMTGSGPGLAFGGHAFDIAAFQDGHRLPSLTLGQPVTVAVHYSTQDVRLISDEGQVGLWWWSGDGWENAANTCDPPLGTSHLPTQRLLQVPICHLSLFSLMGPTNQVHLPLVLRSY